jgi:heat shock protein HtpX
MSNTLKTTFLLALLTGIILAIGRSIGGPNGLVIAFAFAVLMNFGSYWFSDKIVLAMYRAKPVTMQEAPELYSVVQNLAVKAQIPMPRIFVIDSPSPNAFATGRNPEHAAVAATSGILQLMNRDELEGVLAHELSHVKHRDILISSVAATLAGVIMMIADMARWGAIFGGFSRDERENGGGIVGTLALAILAPFAAMLIQMAISRSREYEADAGSARITHNPLALASALEKLGSVTARVPLDASPQTAHMFIVNPLTGRGLAGWFSTHPPLEERIQRLRSMTV